MRRSWLTARQQRGAQPVDLGQRPGGGGLPRQAFLAQRDGGLGGEGLEHPPVVGRERVPAQDQEQPVVDEHLGVALRPGSGWPVDPTARDPPGVAVVLTSGPAAAPRGARAA